MLQESVDMIDVGCLHPSSESENEATPACRVDIIDEILATASVCNASSL